MPTPPSTEGSVARQCDSPRPKPRDPESSAIVVICDELGVPPVLPAPHYPSPSKGGPAILRRALVKSASRQGFASCFPSPDEKGGKTVPTGVLVKESWERMDLGLGAWGLESTNRRGRGKGWKPEGGRVLSRYLRGHGLAPQHERKAVWRM